MALPAPVVAPVAATPPGASAPVAGATAMPAAADASEDHSETPNATSVTAAARRSAGVEAPEGDPALKVQRTAAYELGRRAANAQVVRGTDANGSRRGRDARVRASSQPADGPARRRSRERSPAGVAEAVEHVDTSSSESGRAD